MDVYSWFRRSKKTSLPSPPATTHTGKNSDEELYGVTEQLVDLIKSFTLDTFKNFSLQDERDERGANCGDKGVEATSGKVRKDLSDWQERHATLVLSKVKELSLLRFRLCPRYLKEQQFWRVYFTLVKSCVAEYELHAIRLEKLKQMTVENKHVLDTSACEVEMLEAKLDTSLSYNGSGNK